MDIIMQQKYDGQPELHALGNIACQNDDLKFNTKRGHAQWKADIETLGVGFLLCETYRGVRLDRSWGFDTFSIT